MMPVRVVITLVASLLNATASMAQFGRRAPSLIGVGDRVRVEIRADSSRPPYATADHRIRGTVRAIAPDTLYLDLPSTIGTLPIPRGAIQGVAMSAGTPSPVANALDFGSGGALLGALFLPRFIARPDHSFGSSARAAVVSGGIGFGVGAVIGLFVRYEHWRVAWIPE